MAGKHLFYRPFDSISDLLPLADRKAVKYSFYNIVSVICLFSVFLLCTAIFLVLRVFLRPILWALVVGTCLFPCKSGVTAYFRRFLKRQKENSYPFCLSVFLFPFKFFQSSISTLFDALWPKVIPFIIVFLSTGAFMFLHDFGLFALFGLFLSTIYSLLSDVLALISFVSSLRVITALSVVLIFTTKVVHLYTIQGNMIILIMRYIIFIMIFSCCGVLQPVFIIALFLLLICSRIFSDADSATGNPSTILGSSDAHSTPSCTTASALLRRLSLLPSNDSQAPTLNTVSSADNAVGSRSPTVGFASSSSALVQGCFTGLGLIHFSVAFWTRTWFFRLVLLFGTLGLVAYAVTRLQLVQKALSLIKQTWTPLERKSISLLLPGTDDGRESLFLPTSLKVALRWAGKFDQNLYVIVDEYLDYLVSLVLISLMVLITVLITFFLAVQVYGETLTLISLTSNVLNSTIHSHIFSWLPDKDQLGLVARSAVGNVHQIGKNFIISKVDLLFEGNLAKTDFEHHLLDLWDRVYMHFFVEPNATENVAHRQAAKSTFVFFDASTHGFNKSIDASLFNLFGRLRMFASSFGGFDYRDVVAYFHKNIGTIINVIDPVWRVVSYHAGFITTSLMGTASLLCAGGSVVLNFTFSFLIFLSTLFYLLAASDSTYLPVEFIASLTPQSGDASPAVLSFYTSAEAAVTSVVVTTLKRTVFYGMYTLLIHTLFGLDAVVIPSIIATILGAIPLVGTYWAVLPGVVELLCLRGSYWLAFLLLILHILPYSFMDTALYSEIKGAGHPYLTGLSIAGGLYYFGIEGAFVGPMVLCFVLVGVNLYRCLMLESTDRAQVTRETALRTRVASIDRYRSVNKPRLKLYAHRRNIYRISPKKQTSPMHVQILRARSEGADFGK